MRRNKMMNTLFVTANYVCMNKDEADKEKIYLK